MARTKGSKNKPKTTVAEVERKPLDKHGIPGREHWGDFIYYVMEKTPKGKTPELHSYTENEEGARAVVKTLEAVRTKSIFSIIKRKSPYK